MRKRALHSILALIAALPTGAAAQDHQHPTDLGAVTFRVSCNAEAQVRMSRGVAMLHSFWFPEARRTFQLPARLDATYAAIRSSAPGAELVVLGYPRLFTPNDKCRTLSRAKRAALNDAADQLSEVTAAAAARAGARYVDVREAFAEHGVCSAQPWINALVSPTDDSYHPNKAGQAAYHEALTG